MVLKFIVEQSVTVFGRSQMLKLRGWWVLAFDPFLGPGISRVDHVVCGIVACGAGIRTVMEFSM